MKATELRIGNYVTIDNPKYHPNVKGRTLVILSVQSWREEASVSLMHIEEEDNYVIPSLGQLIDFVKPIELNEEWLLKFGFKRSNDNLFYLPMPQIKSEIHYEKHSYGNVITLQSSVGMFIPNDINYVHELQNLFFALNGEELQTSGCR